ncbi:hypothetical protein GOODEAATRI_026021, partial [Goodea atripinnis]
YNLESGVWNTVPISGGPVPRYGHSLAAYQVYAVDGHTAHCVQLSSGETVMLVIFGYSPIYSYISNVQEYNLRSKVWLLPETKGAIPQGGYGHSSTYDSSSSSIYVHGGYKALPAGKYGLVDDLYRYDPSLIYLEITATLLITLTLSLPCFQGVKNFTECPVRIEQVCSKLANCKSCSLNLNCQWEQNHSQCHSLPGKPDSGA